MNVQSQLTSDHPPARRRSHWWLIAVIALFTALFVLCSYYLFVRSGDGCVMTNDTCLAYKSLSGNRILVLTQHRGLYLIEDNRVYLFNPSSLIVTPVWVVDKRGGRVTLERTNPKTGFDPGLRYENSKRTFSALSDKDHGDIYRVYVFTH